MLGTSSWDDGRKMDRILKAMSSSSSCDDCRKMDSILKATPSASGGDDGCTMPKGQGSSSVEEADQGGNRKMRQGCRSSSVEGADKGGEISLKKGSWTQAEDAILKEFVKNHGEGNWNAVQKYSGLARCGKSCRFRWVNHLKPNLKKGAFTAEEEQRIVELHASMGNKWSKMAAELPGRTDNEIKNFWNTRVKRRQRAYQTTDPEEVKIYRQQVQNGNQENLNPDAALTNEAGQHDSVSQRESYDIRDAEFRRLKLPLCTSDMLSQQYNMLPMMHPSVSDMLADLYQSTHSSLYNMSPMMHPSKRLRGSDMIYNSFDPSSVPKFDQYDISNPRLLSRYDPIFNTSDQFGNVLTGSHASLKGIISVSSDPIYGTFKVVDLPSVQNLESQNHIWRMPESSLPPLESFDTPESSIQFQPNQSVRVTHQNNDGLLESIFYGSKNSNGANNVDSFQQNNDHFVLYEAIQNSTLNPYETQRDEPEALRSSLLLGPFAASVQCDEPEALRSSQGPFASSVVAEGTYITNCISSMETTEDHGDKHGALTEFSADSPSLEIQDPIEFLLNLEPEPDLSFMENDSPSPENQKPKESLLDPDPAPDLSFMENGSTSPENQNPIEFSLEPHPAPDLSFMENDSPSPENQNPWNFLMEPDPSPNLSYMENFYFNGES